MNPLSIFAILVALAALVVALINSWLGKHFNAYTQARLETGPDGQERGFGPLAQTGHILSSAQRSGACTLRWPMPGSAGLNAGAARRQFNRGKKCGEALEP